MMQHTNILRRLFVALGVVGKEKCGKLYKFFSGSCKNYIVVKIAPHLPTSNLL
jgi:hypothetical protein